MACRSGLHLHVLRRISDPTACFICRMGCSLDIRAPGNKFVLKFRHEALHRPGARFAEGADGPPAGDIVRDAEQIIRVALAALAVRQAMKRLAHPERTFPARGALAATFV